MQSRSPQHPVYDKRRRNVRYSFQLEVRFGITGFDRRAPVANISEGGICIKTNEVYKTGTLILITLDLPAGEIHLRGEVMWAIRVPDHQTDFMEHGMGIQFLDAGSEWRKAFASWQDKVL